ncbi:MAG: nitroreductase family protein [Deltaproteobacteria bacterium]|nr:nitroreductase family protein [Deltaproteobacteria bacterium]
MEFSALIAARYSCRAYRQDPVEDAKLRHVLEAARLAPTACNRQPFQLIVIRTQGRAAELTRIYAKDWFAQAPIVICACGIPRDTWVRRDGKNYSDVDVTIAMDHLILAATNVGLGTCWIAAFDVGAAREILGLPSWVEPVAFTPLGYAADTRVEMKRKPLSDLVRFERW